MRALMVMPFRTVRLKISDLPLPISFVYENVKQIVTGQNCHSRLNITNSSLDSKHFIKTKVQRAPSILQMY